MVYQWKYKLIFCLILSTHSINYRTKYQESFVVWISALYTVVKYVIEMVLFFIGFRNLLAFSVFKLYTILPRLPLSKPFRRHMPKANAHTSYNINGILWETDEFSLNLSQFRINSLKWPWELRKMSSYAHSRLLSCSFLSSKGCEHIFCTTCKEL